MGVKFSDIFLKIALFVTIAISILLSFLIWTNNARYERNPNTKIASQQSQTKTNKELADIYLPTQILLARHDQQYMIYNRQDNPTLSYQKQIKSWQKRQITADRAYSREAYLKRLNAGGMVQLNYPDEITWQLFQSIYGWSQAGKLDFKFDRIYMNLSDTKHVYFANDTTRHIHSLQVKENYVGVLRNLLQRADLNLPTSIQWLNGKAVVFYTNSVNMTPYSYLISRENINNYISTLLSDDTDASIEARETGTVTTYYRGMYKKLSIDASNDQIQFEDYTETIPINSMTKLLKNSFTRLSNTGNSLANVRYFSTDTRTQTVLYRSYVEGFPIFQQSDFGVASVQLTTNGEILKFSGRSLQVPVPADNGKATLPSTQTAMDQMVAAGVDMKQIKDIRLSYHWVQTKTSQQVIDLEPTYYVSVNGTWKDYRDLIQAQ